MEIPTISVGDRVLSFTHIFSGYQFGNRTPNKGEGVFQGWSHKSNHGLNDINARELLAAVKPDSGGTIWVLPEDITIL